MKHTTTQTENSEKSSKSQFIRSVRFAPESAEEHKNGSLFINRLGMTDMSGVNIVGCFVDTVRQLYHGKLYGDVVPVLDRCIENDAFFRTGDLPCRDAELPYDHEMPWSVSRMAKTSGYRYKLQNNEIGLILLVGSYYAKLDTMRTHLKIECSPHFLAKFPARRAQHVLDYLSRSFIQDSQPAGCAIHLACDLQGWKPSADFLSNFVTYSRIVRAHDGVDTMSLNDDWTGFALSYGKERTETLTFGRTTSLQCCIYNKTNQARDIDKVDYYTAEWNIYSLGAYDPSKEVFRVEMRFHHDVIKEVNAGEYANIQSYEQLEPILANLWEYALTRNRLELSKGLIDPVWQLMLEDSQFSTVDDSIRIVRKKKQDVSAIAKNYDLIIGNLLTVYARQGADCRHFMKQLKSLSWYDDFIRHLHVNRHMSESEFRQRIEKELLRRRLVRNVA